MRIKSIIHSLTIMTFIFAPMSAMAKLGAKKCLTKAQIQRACSTSSLAQRTSASLAKSGKTSLSSLNALSGAAQANRQALRSQVGPRCKAAAKKACNKQDAQDAMGKLAETDQGLAQSGEAAANAGADSATAPQQKADPNLLAMLGMVGALAMMNAKKNEDQKAAQAGQPVNTTAKKENKFAKYYNPGGQDPTTTAKKAEDGEFGEGIGEGEEPKKKGCNKNKAEKVTKVDPEKVSTAIRAMKDMESHESISDLVKRLVDRGHFDLAYNEINKLQGEMDPAYTQLAGELQDYLDAALEHLGLPPGQSGVQMSMNGY